MREPHLSQTSRCRVGVAVPLSSVPIVVVSLLPPVGAGTHHQDGLTQLNLHPFAGNFRIPIWYPPARLGRLPRQAPAVSFLDTLGRRSAITAAPKARSAGPRASAGAGEPGWRAGWPPGAGGRRAARRRRGSGPAAAPPPGPRRAGRPGPAAPGWTPPARRSARQCRPGAPRGPAARPARPRRRCRRTGRRPPGPSARPGRAGGRSGSGGRARRRVARPGRRPRRAGTPARRPARPARGRTGRPPPARSCPWAPPVRSAVVPYDYHGGVTRRPGRPTMRGMTRRGQEGAPPDRVVLTGGPLRVAEVVSVARGRVPVELGEEGRKRMAAARDV